jgi:hypothetical protein
MTYLSLKEEFEEFEEWVNIGSNKSNIDYYDESNYIKAAIKDILENTKFYEHQTIFEKLFEMTRDSEFFLDQLKINRTSPQIAKFAKFMVNSSKFEVRWQVYELANYLEKNTSLNILRIGLKDKTINGQLCALGNILTNDYFQENDIIEIIQKYRKTNKIEVCFKLFQLDLSQKLTNTDFKKELWVEMSQDADANVANKSKKLLSELENEK